MYKNVHCFKYFLVKIFLFHATNFIIKFNSSFTTYFFVYVHILKLMYQNLVLQFSSGLEYNPKF
jgi:hypothetical protein